MIALDAAEPSLVERWMDEGRLPNLARLRRGGTYGRLSSPARWLAGSPWPTFHTGTLPGEHGLYHFVQWHRERMTLVRPSSDWLPMRPFWREAATAGRRVIAVDVPTTYAPAAFDGVEISGWCNTDLLDPPGSHPPDVFEWARREFGSAKMGGEVYSMQRVSALLSLRDDLIRWTGYTTDLTQALMEREPWDICLVSLAAPHRGGHKLWDATAVTGETTAADADRLSGALLDVYAACDEMVGRLVAREEPLTVLVFSLHGMGPNTSRIAVLPEMLDRVLTGRADRPAPAGLLHRVRAAIPNEWRTRVKDLLPTGVQDRLTVFWRLGDRDLKAAAAFALVADLQGYIRLNVEGRDASGVVKPGAEYDALCARIAEGLATFVDADSGERVVAEVARSDRLYAGGAKLADLPDLIVRWSEKPAAEHRAITSPEFGTIPWPTPGKHGDGRSGNHRPEGFLIASGARIRQGSILEDAQVVDLAPTVFSLLGLARRPEWTGTVLPLEDT